MLQQRTVVSKKSRALWLKRSGLVALLIGSMALVFLGFPDGVHAATGCEHDHVTQGFRCTVEVGSGMCLRERNVRTFAIEACDPRGTTVSIVRQVRLPAHPVNGSTIWDILSNGRMVSDDYVDTGHYNAFSPPIPNPGMSPTPTPTATGTVAVTPTATASPTSLEPVGQGGNWTLRFHDEFDGTTLDTRKWGTCYENFRLGQDCTHDQGELELYRPGNVTVSHGVLTLEAQKQPVVASNGQTYHYTSGMISSGPNCDSCAPHFTFTYGYLEMRAKVPAGQGLWPAFWMLSADGNWPPEIDAFEILGHAPRDLHMTYHWPDGSEEGGQQGHDWTGPDFSAGWHVFAVDWEPGRITWYVDGVARFQYTGSKVASQPMYLVANLAVGGDWPGAPDATTPFPALYHIDYLRVWQH